MAPCLFNGQKYLDSSSCYFYIDPHYTQKAADPYPVLQQFYKLGL